MITLFLFLNLKKIFFFFVGFSMQNIVLFIVLFYLKKIKSIKLKKRLIVNISKTADILTVVLLAFCKHAKKKKKNVKFEFVKKHPFKNTPFLQVAPLCVKQDQTFLQFFYQDFKRQNFACLNFFIALQLTKIIMVNLSKHCIQSETSFRVNSINSSFALTLG